MAIFKPGIGAEFSAGLVVNGAAAHATFRTDAIAELQGTDALLSLFQTTVNGSTAFETAIAFGARDSANAVRKTSSVSSKWADKTAGSGFGVLRLNATKTGGTDDDVALRIFGGQGCEFFGVSDTAGPGDGLVKVNGKVGVGITPSYPLHVETGTASNTSARIINTSATSPFGLAVNFSGAAPNDATQQFLASSDSSTVRFVVRSNGGIANFQANDANLSDERVKVMGDRLDGDLWYERFRQIQIRSFKYKDQTHDDWNIGLSAQQLESIAPDLVDPDGWELPDGGHLKSVYTADLYHAHIAVTQELQRRVEALERR